MCQALVVRACLACVLLLIGCGNTHVVDAGSPIGTCEELLAAANGTACEVPEERCLEGAGACATRIAVCESGVVVQQVVDGDPELEPPDCVDGEIDVTGPLATLDHGVLGGVAGFTNRAELTLANSVPFETCPTQQLLLGFEPNPTSEGLYLGELVARGTLTVDGEDFTVSGIAHITHEQDGELGGTLALSGDTMLDGTFLVRWCPDITLTGP